MSDNTAFESFVEQYQNLVFTVALRLLQNPSDAQDVAQEVFLRAYKEFEMLKDNPSAGGWLRCVARNLCLNYLTRYRARWTVFSDFFHREGNDSESREEWISNFAFESPSEGPSDDQAYVQKALMALPARQRVPLVLYHYEEMSYEEIAKFLKTSLCQVKTDIHRGREALREKILLYRRQSDSGFADFVKTEETAPARKTGRPENFLQRKFSEESRPFFAGLQLLKP